MGDFWLSIVIPAYNEEKRIGDSLRKILMFLENKPFPAEFVIVDDGSTDATEQIVKQSIIGKASLKYLKSEKNMGKGHAVKQGMLASEGTFSLLTDADLSTPIEELEKFLPHMKTPNDVLIGNRKTKGAAMLKKQSFIRENMGKCFTHFTNLVLLMRQSDYTCGFKVFGAGARKRIFGAQRINRWGYDAEVLFLAKLYKLTITEIPVVWYNSEATRVNLALDTFRSIKELFEIRRNRLTGRY
jgi:dolichyl-phosphate beta-glucosyltransferase